MEKRGVIEPGRTPPENDNEKAASAEQLEQHATKRAADVVTDIIKAEDQKFVDAVDNALKGAPQ